MLQYNNTMKATTASQFNLIAFNQIFSPIMTSFNGVCLLMHEVCFLFVLKEVTIKE